MIEGDRMMQARRKLGIDKNLLRPQKGYKFQKLEKELRESRKPFIMQMKSRGGGSD